MWRHDDPDVITHHVCDSDKEANIEIGPRDPDFLTIEEIIKESAERRKKKRGTKTYMWPLCGETFATGRKDNADSHLNKRRGRNPRKVSCSKRKMDPKDDTTKDSGKQVVEI